MSSIFVPARRCFAEPRENEPQQPFARAECEMRAAKPVARRPHHTRLGQDILNVMASHRAPLSSADIMRRLNEPTAVGAITKSLWRLVRDGEVELAGRRTARGGDGGHEYVWRLAQND